MSFFHKLKRRFKKPKNIISLEVDQHKCVGCGACVKKCKHGAITLKPE